MGYTTYQLVQDFNQQYHSSNRKFSMKIHYEWWFAGGQPSQTVEVILTHSQVSLEIMTHNKNPLVY